MQVMLVAKEKTQVHSMAIIKTSEVSCHTTFQTDSVVSAHDALLKERTYFQSEKIVASLATG